MSERWLSIDEAEIAISNREGCSVGRAQKILRDARASGEVRVRNDDPVLLIADDGIVGMDLRPGAMNKGGINLDGQLVSHRLSATSSGDQFSEDDLTGWLNIHHPKAGRRGGRPPAYDWNAIRQVVFELMDHHDEFSVDDPEWNAQARLEEKLCDKFGVSTSALREQLPNMLKDWRNFKVGK